MRAPRAGAAFTLVEVLLAIALVLLLLGAVVASFSATRRGAELDEGAARFETLLRLARAHSANTGRRVQLQFDWDEEDLSWRNLATVKVTWEPDPLGAPGTWQELNEPTWTLEGINELVGVQSTQLGETSETQESTDEIDELLALLDLELGDALNPIVFYPDGTSDSAKIVLLSRDQEDPRKATLELVGVTGVIRRQVVTGEVEDDLLDSLDEVLWEEAGTYK